MHLVNAPAKHLTLRNVPPAIMRALNRERRRKGASLNQTAIDSLGRALGVAAQQPPDNGLSALAGSWSESDLREFEDATAALEQIEDELWR
jgi:hypothetical protein